MVVAHKAEGNRAEAGVAATVDVDRDNPIGVAVLEDHCYNTCWEFLDQQVLKREKKQDRNSFKKEPG